jgi:PAS domain S-box-containing protein
MPTQSSDIFRFNADSALAKSGGRLKMGDLFVAMAVLLIVTTAVTFWIDQRAIHFDRAVLQVHSTTDSLESILSDLKDVENAQRDYLLTGVEDRLVPYRKAAATLPGEFNDLDARAQAGYLAQQDVDALRRMGEQELAETDREIKSVPVPASSGSVLFNAGKDKMNMDGVRALIHRMVMQEEQNAIRFEQEAESASYARAIAFAGTTIINLLFLLWAFNRIKREVRQRESAAERLARQQQLTSVTLSSIADGVIVTDDAGDVVFMNQVAEKLTGWPIRDSLGRSCGFIFRIVDQTTQQPIPNPIESVLRPESAIGLKTQALLLRKDGSNLPISTSSAPIRAQDGTIQGVVLVFRDFSERVQYETDLQRAKQEAESANIAKDNFLAVLSHELRTPLTPVLVTLTAWEQDGRSLPPEIKQEIQGLRRCIELEARLIDDLLDLTRIVRGKLALHCEVVNVHTLIEAVAAMYRADMDAKSIHVKLDLAARRQFASADPGRLQQVFWNILKNATKFTPVGGDITICSANMDDDRLRISFTDSGAGITPEALDKIFQPFEQGSAEVVRRYGGLGLGLSLSRAFIEAQGGTIAASSPGAGLGSTFTICLPTVAQPAQQADTGDSSSGNELPERQLEILLVEDHDDTSRVLSRLLERLGHRVRRADSVAAALAEADRPFDLLLSDIGLPDGTGIELIHELREKYGLQVPAVALTGYGMEEDIAKSREAGFIAHLTKPINFQRLQMMVRKIAETPAPDHAAHPSPRSAQLKDTGISA